MQKCAFKQSPIFLLKQKKIFCEIFRLALKFEMKRGKEIFWLFRSSKGAFIHVGKMHSNVFGISEMALYGIVFFLLGQQSFLRMVRPIE